MRIVFLLLIANCFGSVNFIHINKTGGTTMRALLHDHFRKRDFYPFTKTGVLWQSIYTKKSGRWESANMNAILARFPSVQKKVVAGHFPIWFLAKKDPDFFSKSFNFTVLRDPVDRVLSHYFYMKKLGHPKGDPVQSPCDIPPNHMCFMLCSDNTLTGEALLQDAIANLSRMDCVIFQDDFERGVSRLFRDLGFVHARQIPRLNETQRERLFDASMMQKIREMNDLDIRLYEYADRFLRGKSF